MIQYIKDLLGYRGVQIALISFCTLIFVFVLAALSQDLAILVLIGLCVFVFIIICSGFSGGTGSSSNYEARNNVGFYVAAHELHRQNQQLHQINQQIQQLQNQQPPLPPDIGGF